MEKNSLEIFIEEVRKIWGPLTTQTVAACQTQLSQLLKAPASEDWLADLLAQPRVNQELYRDPQHGFMLLAHSEHQDLYRPPHNHGSGWVIYGVQNGEIEMGSYQQITNQKGQSHLVRRDLSRMHPGESRIYLPGDIHDTKCISPSVLMLRFSSCDLKKEDAEGRMVRYL